MPSYSTPILIDAHGHAARLDRMRLKPGAESSFSEAWLQHLLFQHPSCLPVADIDASIGELIPICCELNTLAGPADILYVNRTGKLVLVETKLFRNPEARRTVVAQIIDYARELTRWTYEDLAREVARASGKGPGHLLDTVRSACDNFDEVAFVDGINRSLSRADLLLLIVGDGITTGTEALVGFLERYGALHFSFGLVEAAVYRTPDGGRMIQPRVLAQTEILRRTLWLASDGSALAEATAPPDTVGEPGNDSTAWFTAFWSEYLARLRLDDLRQVPPAKPARSTNQFMPMPPGGAHCWISAFVSRSSNRAGVYLTFSASYAPGPDTYAKLEQDRNAVEREIGCSLSWRAHEGRHSIQASIGFTDLDDHADRERVLMYLADMSNRFVNVFRPRLEAALRADDDASGRIG